MTTDPVDFISNVIPEIWNAAEEAMRTLAGSGDAEAKQRHADLVQNEGALRVVLEGKGGSELFLAVVKGRMQASKSAPSVPVLVALAVPYEAIELGLEELESEIDAALPKAKRRLARMRPGKAKVLLDKLTSENLRFHQVIKDTPDFDEVRIKITIGGSEPPQQPTFTVTIDYDVFEELRSGKLKPQAMMSKLQLSGDASRAMQLGMELMQGRG